MQGDPISSLTPDLEKLGIIAYLTVSLTLFLRGTVMLASTHREQIKQLREDFQERLKEERGRTEEWKQLAQRSSYVAKETVDLVKKTGV